MIDIQKVTKACLKTTGQETRLDVSGGMRQTDFPSVSFDLFKYNVLLESLKSLSPLYGYFPFVVTKR